jgi:hypothetical protein
VVVRVYDLVGNPKAGATVTWVVNNGGTLLNTTITTNASGQVSSDWQLGPVAGLHTVVVTSPGLPALTVTADVQLPPTGATQHPNEPAGYLRFAEHNMSSLPTFPKTLGGLLGSWYGYPVGNSNLVLVTPDLSAPESPPLVLRTHFPPGMRAGLGPVQWGGWDASGNVNGQKKKLYFSLWLKIMGTDYENQTFGTKMGFIGSALPTSGAGTQGYFLLAGNGSQTPQPSFNVTFHQETGFASAGGFTRILTQNVNRGKLMTVGSWHHWEAVLEVNTLGQPNGVLKWWIDGNLVLDYRDVVYIFGSNTNGFWQWKWNPTWGGTSGTRTRDDYMVTDHVYMSGVP